jgi:peptide/nickel transport system permease protein
MSPAEADRCVSRWREWWLAAHADYQVSAGPERIASVLTETRYGLWALQALTLRLGVEPDGVSVLDRLTHEAPRTALLAGLALLLAYVVAIPLGLLAASRFRTGIDRATTVAVITLFALPVPLIAAMIALCGGVRLALASALTAATVGLVGAPSRQQRIAALEALASDATRLATAAGVHPLRILFLHVARSTTVVAATTLPLDFPMALSAACVVEHVFHINGIGEDLVRAAVDRNVSMLMAFGIIATAANGLVLLGSEVVGAWLDPRLRRALLGEGT